MNVFTKMAKIFFGLSLLISSNTSFAAAFVFYILNSGDSVKNPITITNAYFKNMFSSEDACDAIKPFTDVQVTTGQEQILSYDADIPASCYQFGVAVNLYITTVDGKGINNTCSFPNNNLPFTEDPNQTLYVGTIKITETKDRFFCEFPVGVSKGK